MLSVIMASERISTIGFFAIIFIQVISSTSADFDSDSSCSGVTSNLDKGCSISDDCSTITCNMDFVNKPITFKLKINKCDKPVSVKASMKVPDLGITWSHTYASDDIVEVPGFTASLPDMFSAGVYVQVGITNNHDTDQLRLKVKLLAGAKFLDQGTYPVKTTVLDGDVPISTDDCGWWNGLDDNTKVAVIGGPILLIIIISCCCCCCCCCGCCGCCKSGPSNQRTIVVMAPGRPAAMHGNQPVINRTVPMRPLFQTT